MPKQIIIDEIEAGVDEPCGRRQSLVAINDQDIFIYGGLLPLFTTEHTHPEQCWHYNMATKKWRIKKQTTIKYTYDLLNYRHGRIVFFNPYVADKRQYRVVIDPAIMWASGFAPTSYNGFAFPASFSTRQSVNPLPLFFFAVRNRNATIEFFIVYLEEEIIVCRRLNLIDTDSSFNVISPNLPVSRSDFFADIRVWFLPESYNNIFIVWNSYEHVRYFGNDDYYDQQEVFEIFELKKIPYNAASNNITTDNFGTIWNWRKLRQQQPHNNDNDNLLPLLKEICNSTKPLIFLWTFGRSTRQLCFMSRCRLVPNSLSYIVKFDLNSFKFTWENNYGNPLCDEKTISLPYIIFDNFFVLLESMSHGQLEDQSKEEKEKIIIWIFDLKTNFWIKWQRILVTEKRGKTNCNKSNSDADNEKNYLPPTILDSTAQFDNTGTTIYIFGGRHPHQNGQTLFTNAITYICFQPQSLQQISNAVLNFGK